MKKPTIQPKNLPRKSLSPKPIQKSKPIGQQINRVLQTVGYEYVHPLISAIFAILITMFILPPLLFGESEGFDSTNAFTSANFIIWLGFIVLIISFIAGLIIMNQSFNITYVSLNIIVSALATLIVLCSISFVLIILGDYPLTTTITATGMIYYIEYLTEFLTQLILSPTYLVILTNSVQIFWFLSILVYVIIYVAVLYLAKSRGFVFTK